jgi:hypothetical protein
LGFRTGLAGSQAVVKHPEQAVEQVAPHSGIAFTGVLRPVPMVSDEHEPSTSPERANLLSPGQPNGVAAQGADVR